MDLFRPRMALPHHNAEPPGGRACGAIAGQLIQAAGKLVRWQDELTSLVISSIRPRRIDKVRL